LALLPTLSRDCGICVDKTGATGAAGTLVIFGRTDLGGLTRFSRL